MKLFRFIYNVWNSAWDAAFDGDAKSLAKHMAGYAGGAIVLGFIFYIFGLFGEWVGIMEFMPLDKRDSTLALGTGMFLILFTGLMVCLYLWDVGLKLIEIWRKS